MVIQQRLVVRLILRYSIVASDIDTGDTLTITAQTTLPSWLSLTTTGGGTETLSGTPTNSEVGIIL